MVVCRSRGHKEFTQHQNTVPDLQEAVWYRVYFYLERLSFNNMQQNGLLSYVDLQIITLPCQQNGNNQYFTHEHFMCSNN